MADGNITIAAEIDDKQAEKQLRALNTKIARLEEQIGKKNNDRMPIVEQLQQAQQEAVKTYEEIERLKAELAASEEKTGINGNVTPDQWLEELENQKRIKDEIAQQEKLLADQEKTAQRLEGQDAKIVAKIEEMTAELERSKEAAGELTARLSHEGDGGGIEKIKGALAQINSSIGKAVKKMLLWGIGVRSVYALFKRLKSYIKDAVKAYAESDPGTKAQMDNLKQSLATLKASWGAAFAPVVSAVIPILQTLISWLTTAANAVAAFFAALSGKTTFKKAIANTNALGKSLKGAGGAAKDVKKQLMGIDEMNVMQDQSGGGGGGGGSAANDADYVEEAISEKLKNKVQWLKDHLGEILDIVGLIGAALLAWKLAPLLGVSFLKIFGILGAIVLAVSFVKDGINAWVNGVDWNTVISMFTKAVAIAALLGLALGGTAAAIALIVGGIAMLVVGIHDWIEKGELTTETMYLLIGAIALLAVGLTMLVGGPIPLIVAAIVALALVIYKNWGTIADWFNEHVGEPIKKAWENIKKWFSDGVQNVVGKAQDFWQKIKNIAAKLKEAFNFQFKMPKLKMPHLTVTWQDAGLLGQFFGITKIPHIGVQWYAKGGVVDGATLIGAGEAGKEAIVPLERNTEWIRMVAKGLADELFGDGELSEIADRIAKIPEALDRMTAQISSLTLPPLPAVAQGQIVPPNAYSGSYGLSGDLADKLSAFLDRFGSNGAASPIEIHTTVELDRRKVGEATYSYIKDRERGRG